MKVIDFESVKQVEKMNPAVWCEWVDDALRAFFCIELVQVFPAHFASFRKVSGFLLI